MDVLVSISFSFSININFRNIYALLFPIGIPFMPSVNYLLDTIASWGPLFKVSFQLKLNNYGNKIDSLLHFTATDSNGLGAGERVPAIFVKSSGYLLFRAHIGTTTDWGFNKKWDLGEWHDVSMIQHVKNGEV